MSNSPARLSQLCLLVMEELIAAEKWTSVEMMCTEAFAADAHNARLFVNRGIARSHLQSHSDALEDFQLAITLEPLNCKTVLERACALLHIGLAVEAEDLAKVVLEEDIGDRRALDLLKQVAVVKFRAIVAKGSASGERTQLSLLQMHWRLNDEQLSPEEMHSVIVELMRFWCDRIENFEDALCFLSTKALIKLMARLCDRLDEYRLSIFCFYLAYGAILEDQRSATLEITYVLRGLSTEYMRMGNHEPARKFLTMAVEH